MLTQTDLAKLSQWTVLTYRPSICKDWEPLPEIAVKDSYWYYCGSKVRKILSGETFENNHVPPVQIQDNWRNLQALKSFVGKPYYGYLTFSWGETPTEKAIVDVDGNGRISRIRTYSGMNWSAKNGYGSPICDTGKI